MPLLNLLPPWGGQFSEQIKSGLIAHSSLSPTAGHIHGPAQDQRVAIDYGTPPTPKTQIFGPGVRIYLIWKVVTEIFPAAIWAFFQPLLSFNASQRRSSAR